MKKFWFLFVDGAPLLASTSEAAAQAASDGMQENGITQTRAMVLLSKRELEVALYVLFGKNAKLNASRVWDEAKEIT